MINLEDLKNYLKNNDTMSTRDYQEYWGRVYLNVWQNKRLYVNYVYGRTVKGMTKWKHSVVFYVDADGDIVFAKNRSTYPNATERESVREWLEENIKDFNLGG